MKIDIRKIRRNLFGFLSFSAALFIFQACYGTPQDRYNDVLIKGKLVSDSTGQAAAGIKVVVNDSGQFAVSDSNGMFSFYVPVSDKYHFMISDPDTNLNGFFLNKDTVFTALPQNDIILTVAQK